MTPIPSGLQRRYRLQPGPRYHSVEFVGTADRYLLHLADDAGALHSHNFDTLTGRLSPVAGERYVTLIAPNGRSGVIPGGSALQLVNLENQEVRRVCALASGWLPIRWSVTRADGLAQDSVYSLYVTRDRTIWAGTLSAGVSMLRDDQFTNFTVANGLASNTVVSILEGSDGTMWFATPSGLSALSSKEACAEPVTASSTGTGLRRE